MQKTHPMADSSVGCKYDRQRAGMQWSPRDHISLLERSPGPYGPLAPLPTEISGIILAKDPDESVGCRS